MNRLAWIQQQKAAAIAAHQWAAAAAFRDEERRLQAAQPEPERPAQQPSRFEKALSDSRQWMTERLHNPLQSMEDLEPILWHLRVLKALKELFRLLHSPAEYRAVHHELQYWLKIIAQEGLLTREAYATLYQELTLVSSRHDRTMLYRLFSSAIRNEPKAIQSIQRLAVFLMHTKFEKGAILDPEMVTMKMIGDFRNFTNCEIDWPTFLMLQNSNI